MIDSLQLTAKHQLATPADRQAGEGCIIVPAVTDEVADQRYPNASRRVKPCPRFVAAPTN